VLVDWTISPLIFNICRRIKLSGMAMPTGQPDHGGKVMFLVWNQ
jgi:hypothetical protein